MVEFRRPIWESRKKLDEATKGVQYEGNWLFSEGGDPRSVTLVGKDGHVFYQDLDKPGIDLSIPKQDGIKTSRDLRWVWGAGPEKFWVMDTNGTIWERGIKSEWGRPVVMGMHTTDVTFEDAWVSPTGTIIAITKKHIWRLK